MVDKIHLKCCDNIDGSVLTVLDNQSFIVLFWITLVAKKCFVSLKQFFIKK